MNTNRLRKPN